MLPTSICPKTVEDLVSWQIKVNFKGSRRSFCFIFRRRQTQVTVRPTWQDLAHLGALQKMKEQNGTKRTTDSLIRFRTESVVEDRIKISTLLPDIFVTDNNTSVFRLGRVLARASRGHTCLRSWFLKKQKKETFYLSGTVQWYVFALTQRILIKQHGAKHRRYNRVTRLSRDGSGVDVGGRTCVHTPDQDYVPEDSCRTCLLLRPDLCPSGPRCTRGDSCPSHSVSLSNIIEIRTNVR